MKIYQEPSPPTTITTPRRAVSFAAHGGSASAIGAGDYSRTPTTLTKSGRKPLTPHNPQQPSPMQSLRRSLKEGGGGDSSGMKKKKTNSFLQTPQKYGSSSSTMDKENQEHAAATPTTATRSSVTTTPTTNSASAFRRSLRATLSPPSSTSSKATTQHQTMTVQPTSSSSQPLQEVGVGRRLGGRSEQQTQPRTTTSNNNNWTPQQRHQQQRHQQPPKTPNSILRTELEEEDSLDEDFSLLVSPSAGVSFFSRLNDNNHNLTTTAMPTTTTSTMSMQMQMSDDTRLVLVSPAAAAAIYNSVTKESPPLFQATTTTGAITSTTTTNTTDTPSPLVQPRTLNKTTPPSAAQAVEQAVEKEETTSAAAFAPKHKTTTRFGPQLLLKSSTTTTASLLGKPVRNTQAVGRAMARESKEQVRVGPGKGGVCLDLSELFLDTTKPLKTTSPPAALEQRLLESRTVRARAKTVPVPQPQQAIKTTGVKAKATKSFAPTKTTAKSKTTNSAVAAAPVQITTRPVKKVRVPFNRQKAFELAKSRMSEAPTDTDTNFSVQVVQQMQVVQQVPPFVDAETEEPIPTMSNKISNRQAAQLQFESEASSEPESSTAATRPVKKVRVPFDRQKAFELAKSRASTDADADTNFGVAFQVQVPFATEENTPAMSNKISDRQAQLQFESSSEPEESSTAATPQIKNNSIAFDISAPHSHHKSKSTPYVSNKTRAHAATGTNGVNVKPGDTWADKQCETFVSWLNYTFTPTEDEDNEESNSNATTGGGTSTSRTSPSRGALRTLVLHRRMAQTRMKGAELFHGRDMLKVRAIVQAEIGRGKVTIRDDRDVYADLSLRRQITTLLLSYTTPWLRLGLEMLLGEPISLLDSTSTVASTITITSPNRCSSPMATKASRNQTAATAAAATSDSRMRNLLKSVIVNRVLSDAKILAKYTKGKCKVPSGKFGKLYLEEMRALVLYRLVVLIIYLDRAKEANIIDKVPRMFTKTSSVKSSRSVLLALCRDILSAEGDFTKHLSRIGLVVSYKQEPVDEVEFVVSNLAVDLRDGVRLTRMVEILTEAPTKSVMTTLRLPAVSRLQKLHNVGVAISKLTDFGITITSDVNSHHIVDGHREMVLKLMWSVIAHCCMRKLLEKNLVEEEIRSVLRSNRARRKVEGRLALPESESNEASFPDNASPEEILKSLLFRWCQAVCSGFGLTLTDFTTCFADGKALCLLVHYYHPSAIRLDEIRPTSNGNVPELSKEEAIRNERMNSTLAGVCVYELGGIPKMLPVTDSSNPPNEQSMLLCLSYLCSRLMESSKEIFASILIQAAYRKYQEKILLERKRAAALVIFQTWCRFKDNYYRALQQKYARAVGTLERFVLAHKDSLVRLRNLRLTEERRQFASIQIQVCIVSSREQHALFLCLGYNTLVPLYLTFFVTMFAWTEMLSGIDGQDRVCRTLGSNAVGDSHSERMEMLFCKERNINARLAKGLGLHDTTNLERTLLATGIYFHYPFRH
jgi:hypothetical protein